MPLLNILHCHPYVFLTTAFSRLLIKNLFSSQLDKLKRSYHKLQRKHLKETDGGAKTKDMTRLNEKIEVQRHKSNSSFLLPWSLIDCPLLPSTCYMGYKHPCLSLQEYQQLSVDWEKQRVQYQNHQTALEAQNKSLTDELTHIKVRQIYNFFIMSWQHNSVKSDRSQVIFSHILSSDF